jgi:hypothetical protein
MVLSTLASNPNAAFRGSAETARIRQQEIPVELRAPSLNIEGLFVRYRSCLIVAVLCFAAALPAQRRVDPRYSYHRVIAVVPLQGAGTADDPIRPKHAPAAQAGGPSRAGIIAFTFQLSDDGKYAIAEFVAVDRAGLAEVLADREPGVLVFEVGVAKSTNIESAIRRFRRNFSLQNFGVAQ